tara:strand:+ start:24523 stop:25251 length:729 start_codon:yes stop_codon:yes gene_type:complete
MFTNNKETIGNFLFKYRGQFPLIIFVISVPFIFNTKLPVKFILYNTISFIITLSGFLIRFYSVATTPKGTSGRNTKKQIAEKLNTTGIYSVVRHPLYLGNFLIWIGISFFVYNIYFIIINIILFYLFYRYIVFSEENFLQKVYNNEYIQWSRKTPAFFPNIFLFKSSSVSFSIKSILRREYPGVLAAVISFSYIDIIRNIFTNKNIVINDDLAYLLIITFFFAIFLKILKHHTNFLEEKDRS